MAPLFDHLDSARIVREKLVSVQMHDTFGRPNRSGRQGNFIEAQFAISANRADGRGLEVKIQQIIADRHDRERFFAEEMFADPAWDILLELALAEQQQRRVCVTTLCIGSRVPQTTALRWIKHMTDMKWLVRRDDPLDARRKFIELSAETSARMRAYLLSLGSHHPSPEAGQ